jgi:hypothetical protein
MFLLFAQMLSANGFSSGGVMSVYDDGPFNAVKNPALLARTDSSVGLFLYGSPYAKGKSTLLEINGNDDGNIKTDSRKYVSSNLSFVKSLKKVSFGLSFALQGDDDNYYSRKSSGSYFGADTFSTNEKRNAVGAFLSAAYKINSAYSVGLRMYTSYKKESNEEYEFNVIRTVKEKNTDSFAISPAFGFNMRSRKNLVEFGFILSGGTYVKKKYDYNFKRSDGKNGNASYSSRFELTQSPSITLGILKRFKKISFSAESVFYIPAKYDDKGFSVNDEGTSIVITDKKCKNTFRIDQRLGCEYMISRSTAVSSGIGYIQMRQNNDFSKLTESGEDRVDVRIFLFSLGIDKKISPDTKIIVASSNHLILNKFETKASGLSIKINSYEFVPNIMFALVQKF